MTRPALKSRLPTTVSSNNSLSTKKRCRQRRLDKANCLIKVEEDTTDVVHWSRRSRKRQADPLSKSRSRRKDLTWPAFFLRTLAISTITPVPAQDANAKPDHRCARKEIELRGCPPDRHTHNSMQCTHHAFVTETRYVSSTHIRMTILFPRGN